MQNASPQKSIIPRSTTLLSAIQELKGSAQILNNLLAREITKGNQNERFLLEVAKIVNGLFKIGKSGSAQPELPFLFGRALDRCHPVGSAGQARPIFELRLTACLEKLSDYLIARYFPAAAAPSVFLANGGEKLVLKSGNYTVLISKATFHCSRVPFQIGAELDRKINPIKPCLPVTHYIGKMPFDFAVLDPLPGVSLEKLIGNNIKSHLDLIRKAGRHLREVAEIAQSLSLNISTTQSTAGEMKDQLNSKSFKAELSGNGGLSRKELSTIQLCLNLAIQNSETYALVHTDAALRNFISTSTETPADASVKAIDLDAFALAPSHHQITGCLYPDDRQYTLRQKALIASALIAGYTDKRPEQVRILLAACGENFHRTTKDFSQELACNESRLARQSLRKIRDTLQLAGILQASL